MIRLDIVFVLAEAPVHLKHDEAHPDGVECLSTTHDTVSHSLQAFKRVESGLIGPYLSYQHHRIIPSEVPRDPYPCDGAQYDGDPRGTKDGPIDANEHSVHVAVPIHRRWAALKTHERESNGRQCCGGFKEGNASDARVALIEGVTVRWK